VLIVRFILVFNTLCGYNCVKGRNLRKIQKEFTKKGGEIVRIATLIFGILAAIVDIVLLIVSICVPEDSMWGAVLALTFVTAALFVVSGKQKKKKKAASEPVRPFMDEESLSGIVRGILPEISGTPVVLKEGEHARFYAPAIRYQTKRKAVGRTGGGAGVSVRVAKGVSVRSGAGSSKTVYGDVTDSFQGTVVLTDRRIVFLNSQSGFECPVSSITSIESEDGNILIQSGQKNYVLAVPGIDLFEKALRIVMNK